MELEEIIRFIYPVSDEGIKRIADSVRLFHLKKGGLLISQGKKNDNLYFVHKGLLRSFCENDGKEDTQWFATSGDAVASIHSLYKGLPAMSSIEAVVATDLYYISRSEMDVLFSSSVELACWAYALAMEELYALERRYIYIGVGDAYARYKSFMKLRPAEVVRQIPLKYIASYLKITPQTLSKIRLKYAKEKG